MSLPPARISTNIVWRSSPARFVVAFYDSTLILHEHGNRLVPECYVLKGETERRPIKGYGAWRLKPEHENFIDCMMMATPETERLERIAKHG